jgi:hypothetical protein
VVEVKVTLSLSCGSGGAFVGWRYILLKLHAVNSKTVNMVIADFISFLFFSLSPTTG